MKMKAIFALFLAVMLWVSLPGTAFAHVMQTDYSLLSQSKEFQVQATMSTGESGKNAVVKVYSPKDANTPWMEGKTDQDGKFAFKPDLSVSGDWTIRIGEGDHGDILTVPVSQSGIDLDKVSNLGHPKHVASNQWAVLGFASIAGVLGSRFFSSRKFF
jgi:nickel transport protein